MAHYHTIKVLLAQGKSVRSIAKELEIHRHTVRQIKRRLQQGLGPPQYEREGLLDGYEERITRYLEEDQLTATLIHERLARDHRLSVSYSTVQRLVKKLKAKTQSFVPLHSGPGEEAQVDFGYLGKFADRSGRPIKVWVFSMVLSHSRYAYHEVVRDQKVPTFIRCHRNAFEYFGGVPRRIKLDNLKSGVIHPDFYEPILQEQYSEFLAHYGCAGVPCKVYKPEHKGKVESGVKYVKGNFALGLKADQRHWEGLQDLLLRWTDERCNRRKHGTTHRVPAEVFAQSERVALGPLPTHRYEFYRWEKRKVTSLGHITFDCNYYSVPHTLVGREVLVKSNGLLVRIYDGEEQVAVHELARDKGQYLTRSEHLPPHKRERSLEAYRQKMQAIGPEALAFLEACRLHDAHHWKEKTRGVLSLRSHFPGELIEQACQSALQHQLYSYRSVKRICEHRARGQPQTVAEPPTILSSTHGYHHDLSAYDQL